VVSRRVDAARQVWGEEVVRDLRGLGRPPEWLRRPSISGEAGAAVARSIPEFVSGELKLLGCKFKRAWLEHGSWTGVYRVTVQDREQERTVDLRGELVLPAQDPPARTSSEARFGEEGWHCYVPGLRLVLTAEPPESALPAMSLLADPEQARILLESGMRAGSPANADLRIAGCSLEVMRYKPGRRCTIRYELEFPPDSHDPRWPDRVVAKTYGEDEGRYAYEGMRALWSSRLRTSQVVTIAEPLAFLPESNVLVQGLVPGKLTLKKLIESSLAPGDPESVRTLSPHVRRVGMGLAELHTCGADGGDAITWASEVGAVEETIGKLAMRVPELANAATPLMTLLEAAASEILPEPLVPTHRSFRPAQVLLEGDDIGFIDFDGFCRAEPGLDLALFRITLKELCLRALTQKGKRSVGDEELHEFLVRLDELGDSFLSGYEEVSSVSRGRLALWEALVILDDIFTCWRKLKFDHLERRMDFLHHHLATGGASLAAGRRSGCS
jgi:hypothetical protein